MKRCSRALLVETSGAVAGRINGLSVLSLGDYGFGQPTRLTSTVAPGRRGVVSIEREVVLSGPIHGKGVPDPQRVSPAAARLAV
jgi:predicted ATP-dependent protease